MFFHTACVSSPLRQALGTGPPRGEAAERSGEVHRAERSRQTPVPMGVAGCGWSRLGHLDILPLIDVGGNASPLLTEAPEAAVDGRKPATDQHHAEDVLRLQSLAEHHCPQ